MAFASPLHSPMSLRCMSSLQTDRLLVAHLRANLTLSRHRSPRSDVAFSRRRNNTSSAITSSKKKKQRLPHNDVTEDDLGEDAFEALFSLLEEDLKNDPSFDDGDGKLCEEDLAKLELELEEALEDDELLGAFVSTEEDVLSNHAEDEDRVDDDDVDEEEVEEEEDEEDNEEKLVKLKTWQLRRLAYALKNGRRKTSIKNLAGDVCLDRAVVLQLLRDPPPKLLLMSAALVDKPILAIADPESTPLETVSSESTADVVQPEAKVKVPVHVMQSSWSARKRLKKVQVETLERVYVRTRRPTNAMISSIVHVTNLPRKRVVKWFEDKRAEDGVADHRLPYRRSAASETVFN